MIDPDEDPGLQLRIWLVAAVAITILAGAWSFAMFMGWLQ